MFEHKSTCNTCTLYVVQLTVECTVLVKVRFVYECLRHLRPGVSLLALHGGMSQQRRLRVYEEFVRKEHAALLATDVAARGLGAPSQLVQVLCAPRRPARTRFSSARACFRPL